MRCPRFLHAALLSLALPACAGALFAQTPAWTPSVPGPRHYLTADFAQVAQNLPPPPAPGSTGAEADLQAVLQVQSWRTTAQIDWAKRVDRQGLFDFADVLGSGFNPQNLPLTAALVKAVDDDLDGYVGAAKKLFMRKRPYDADLRIHPCVGHREDLSYPSGHSTGIFVEAEVLAKLFPDKQEAIDAYARRWAWGRVIGGVHFPTDLVGGRILAGLIAADLEKSPLFAHDLEACRAEVASHSLGAPVTP